MNQWRVEDNRVPLQDIATATNRSLSTVMSLVGRAQIATKLVPFKGSGHPLATIDAADVDKLLEAIARAQRYTKRNGREKAEPETEPESPVQRRKPVRARASSNGDNDATYADFEQCARRFKILAEKFKVSEAHFVDGKWEITRSIEQTIEM